MFANIPFNATAAIVARVTAEPTAALDAYLVLQREAAERFIGEPRGTLAAALLHPWFEPSVVHRFRRSDFLPAPRVEVALLRLRKRGPPLVGEEEAGRFRDLVSWLYTAWRPTVGEALAVAAGAEAARRMGRQAGLDLGRPPAALANNEWLRLFSAVAGAGAGRLWAEVAGASERHRLRAGGVAEPDDARSAVAEGRPPRQGSRRR